MTILYWTAVFAAGNVLLAVLNIFAANGFNESGGWIGAALGWFVVVLYSLGWQGEKNEYR